MHREKEPKTGPNPSITSISKPRYLFCISFRPAYINKKYHSGTTCLGVLEGLECMLLTGLSTSLGKKHELTVKQARTTVNRNRSFIIKKGYR